MTFQPIIAGSGLGAWIMLKRTYSDQLRVHSNSNVVAREGQRAEDTLATISSIDALVDDRSNLKVALTAFGLEDDINSTFFIKKMLASDLSDQKSLANRMSDARYKKFVDAFAHLRLNKLPGDDFGAKVRQSYEEKSFEVSVGQQDTNLRLALEAEREFAELAQSGKTNKTLWYNVLGTPALRKVMQTYLRLPDSIAKIDLDKQVEMFQDKLGQRMGDDTITQFTDADKMTELVEGFLLQSQIQEQSSLNAGSIALSLLQSTQFDIF